MTTFSNLFKNYLNTYIGATAKCTPVMVKQNMTLTIPDFFQSLNIDMSDISTQINDEYYFSLLQRLVYDILYLNLFYYILFLICLTLLLTHVRKRRFKL